MDDRALSDALDPIPTGWPRGNDFRRAAVLAPLVSVRGVPSLVLTERPTTMPSHAGQVAFPGGMRHGDETPADCALREAEEELGIPADSVTLLGAMRPRVASSAVSVHVLVGRLVVDQPLQPDPREVARVLVVPVDHLADHGRWIWREPDNWPRRMPHFDLEGAVLWGLTARFVLDLLERIGHPPLNHS